MQHSGVKIRVFDTQPEAGAYVAALMERVVLTVDEPVFGLATGSTMVPLYKAFVRLVDCGLDVSAVRTINLDEYVGLCGQHPQSYRHFMNQHLFSHVPIPEDHTYLPDGSAADIDAECERYDQVIGAYPIHLQLLGIGVNGHIGFNEPDDLLVSRTHVVRLSDETIHANSRFFDSVESVPRQAITLGVQAILQAEQIVLLAFGEAKAQAVVQSIRGDVRTDVPASILQLHRDVMFVLDRESASKLDLFDSPGGTRHG